MDSSQYHRTEKDIIKDSILNDPTSQNLLIGEGLKEEHHLEVLEIDQKLESECVLYSNKA